MSLRSLRGVACAITYHNTWHQCRKLFWRYIAHHFLAFHILSLLNQIVTSPTKFRKLNFHIHAFTERTFRCNWFVSERSSLSRKRVSWLFSDIISFRGMGPWIFYLPLRVSRVVRAIWCGTWRYSPRTWRPASVKFSRLVLRKRRRRSSCSSCDRKYRGYLRSETSFSKRSIVYCFRARMFKICLREISPSIFLAKKLIFLN